MGVLATVRIDEMTICFSVLVESGNSTPNSEHSEGDGVYGRNTITGKKSSSNCIPSNGSLPHNRLPVEQDPAANQGKKDFWAAAFKRTIFFSGFFGGFVNSSKLVKQ